eukprot:TRINITY_DN31237_c0_g1_i1.p1 TRINITY_DN31237_c0_g1~~TRINITY_DN31237_c0_g1_i1.p1  ORF type:complete len:862 (+),score=167.71 TRINITY_DN31237_c0_g1_i1:180-2765(+)
MDEEQYMERFGMENDFEGGQWIGGEFYYKKRKEKVQQTKDQVLYGVFNDSDSDEEDFDGFSKRKKKRKGDLITKNDLTKPVNFVSTGSVRPSEQLEKKSEENERENDSFRGGLGLGSAEGAGLGFRGSEQASKQAVEDEFLPTAFGKKIKENVERREREKKEKEKEKDRMVSSKSRVFGNSDIGEFEKHTKGIGLKLLEKMGYKGGGLGKNQQGIAVPIEAKLRPRNMGMGFNDFKEASSVPSLSAFQPEAEELKPKTREKLWTKTSKNRKKEYVTAEEFLAKKHEEGIEVVQKVLDMRGPQVRVLTNLESLNAEQKAIEEQMPMPELQHNIRLLVDTTEADIQKFDRDLRHARESVAIFQKEKERLQQQAERQRRQLEGIESIKLALDQVRQNINSGVITLESLASIFQNIRSSYREDYKLCNVACIAASYACPLLVRVFERWDPLQQPSHGVDIMVAWQRLLQEDESRDYGIYTEAELGQSGIYNSLFFEVVLPAVRRAAVNFWEPRDPEPMIRFLEAWEKALPASALHNILHQLVMPKLTTAVDLWDPLKETVPIHAWLHPWLPYLGQDMEPLYPPIQHKLRNVLQAWHASDASALTILSPWKTVFDPAGWEQLIVFSIKPKLMAALHEFQVNPAEQILDQFNWVMNWASTVPIRHMVEILETCFFPKWHQVLYHWLCSNPNFDEVTQWFLGWKGLFPAELLENERIRVLLNMALEMMNQAVQGMTVEQPGARENVSYLRATEQRQFEALQQQKRTAGYRERQPSTAFANGTPQNYGGTAPEMSFKGAIEMFAQEHDIQFLPKVGRTHDGLQVYSFGNVSICLDLVNQMVLAQSGERWVSTTLAQLLEMSRGRTSRNQ